MRTKASPSSFSSPAESHISGAACQGYFITRGKGCSQEGSEPLATSIFCPSASSAGVGYLCGITHEQRRRDKECSISHPDVPLLDDLPPHPLPIAIFLTKEFVMRWVLTIDKDSEHHEISALSHIALLQGGGKGSQNVDSSCTPPLSPTRAPRPASRESCGEGGGGRGQ